MAEFCIGCLNKLSNRNYREKDYILAEGFCEGCGKTALVVVRERRQERIFNPIEYLRKKVIEQSLKNQNANQIKNDNHHR